LRPFRPDAPVLDLALPDRRQPLPRLPPPAAAGADGRGTRRRMRRRRRGDGGRHRRAPVARSTPRGAAQRRPAALLPGSARGRGRRDPRRPAWHGEESTAQRARPAERAGAGREGTHGMTDDEIARLLDAYVVPEPPPELGAGVLRAAAPLLARR